MPCIGFYINKNLRPIGTIEIKLPLTLAEPVNSIEYVTLKI